MNPHEVLYAEVGRVWRRVLLMPQGAAVSELLDRLRQDCADWPQAALAPAALAVFGRLVEPEQRLRPGDRLELLRCLPTDPKRARRERAAQGRS